MATALGRVIAEYQGVARKRFKRAICVQGEVLTLILAAQGLFDADPRAIRFQWSSNYNQDSLPQC